MEKYDVKKDYYKILGINSDATLNQIDSAYYEKASKCLPEDKPADERKIWTNKLAEIVEAYKVLKDEETRKEYDIATNRKVIVEEEPKEKLTPVKVEIVEDDDYTEEVAEKGRLHINKLTVGLVVVIIVLAGTLLFMNKKKEYSIKDSDLDDEFTTENNETIIIEEKDLDKIIEEVEEPIAVAYEDENTSVFSDATNPNQVNRRAILIQAFLEKSNVHNVSVEEIEDAIKFINGSYSAETEMQAYDELNNLFSIFDSYSKEIAQASNFAAGVVDENGVNVAMGFDALLVDNTKHSSFMDEAAILFQNVLTSNTNETKIVASKEFLNQQAMLKLGLLVDDTGSKMSYSSLENGESFVYGLMSQYATPIIKAALGDNYCLTYPDNLGEDYDYGIDNILAYYNPIDCDGVYNNENLWNLCTRELVKNCLLNKDKEMQLSLTLDDNDNN